MKGLLLYGEKDLRLEELPMPICGPDEVLVKSKFCGVCGSDVPRVLKYSDKRKYPRALGHEFSAVVAAVGQHVDHVLPGDLVVVVPLIVCHRCVDCQNGHFGQCKNAKFIGDGFADKGGFIEYNVIPKENILKMPDGMQARQAAFVEPLSVALHGLFLMGMRKHKPLAVVGVGTIGLLVLQAAKAMALGPIHVFDVNQQRLALARKLGADYVYDNHDPQFMDRYLDRTEGRGVTQVIEAVGMNETINLAVKIADTGADIAIIGGMVENVVMDPFTFYLTFSRRQMNMHGVWMSYSENFPGEAWRQAAELIAAGKIDIDTMIDRTVPITEALPSILDYETANKVKGKILLSWE